MPCKVAIIGASNLVGREILKTLSDRSFPLSEVRLFDMGSSVGQYLGFGNKEILIEEFSEHVIKESRFRIVFSCGSFKESQKILPLLQETGAFVIDTSLHTHHSNIPLIVSDINAHQMKNHKVFANPSSLSVHLSMILQPILSESNIKRTVISTYQSVSGAGFFGVEELERQISEIEQAKDPSIHYFSHQIAFNVIPQVGEITENQWSKEEINVAYEIQSILEKDFDITLTCVRVPVLRGHGASIMIELEKPLSIEQIYQLWEYKGILAYHDDLPTPWDFEGTVDIAVSRLRQDPKHKNIYYFWTVADNLSLGMALNSVQIAEQLTF